MVGHRSIGLPECGPTESSAPEPCLYYFKTISFWPSGRGDKGEGEKGGLYTVSAVKKQGTLKHTVHLQYSIHL